MTTSGITTFNPTASEIITEALEQLGVIGVGQSVEGEDYISCLRSLNMMVKHLQNKGINIYSETPFTVFLDSGVSSYILGGSSSCKAARGDVVETSLGVSAAAAATSLTLYTTTGMTVGDTIGIVQDNGTIKWTTIATIPTSTTLTIDAALSGAATLGNMVFTYTTSIGRPLDIVSAYLRRSGGTDTSLSQSALDSPLKFVSKDTYQTFGLKGVKGVTTQLMVDKQSTYTKLYVYPTPAVAYHRIKGTMKRVIEDFSSSADTADFPQEWVGALALSLAVWVANKYSKGKKIAEEGLAPMAEAALRSALGASLESAPFSVAPEL